MQGAGHEFANLGGEPVIRVVESGITDSASRAVRVGQESGHELVESIGLIREDRVSGILHDLESAVVQSRCHIPLGGKKWRIRGGDHERRPTEFGNRRTAVGSEEIRDEHGDTGVRGCLQRIAHEPVEVRLRKTLFEDACLAYCSGSSGGSPSLLRAAFARARSDPRSSCHRPRP